MSIAVCRVCIVSDVRMHSIENDLQEIYEKLTSSKLGKDDGKSNAVCYICYSQLQRCWRFCKTALQSENLLKQLDHENVQQHTLSHRPLVNLRVVENLLVTITQPMYTGESDNMPEKSHNNNYVCTYETKPTSVKIEIDVKKEALTINEDLVKSELVINDALQNTDSIKDNDIPIIPNTHCCDVCSKEFATKSQMQSHFRSHRDKSLKCAKCDKPFIKVHYFREHAKTCNNKPGMVHTCSTCGKTFTKVIYLKKHVKTHLEERPFSCAQCTYTFKTKDSLQKHMLSHSKKKACACEICGKMFTRISYLKTHMKIHDGIKPYSCEVCGNAFITNSSLKSHMKYHTRERPYTCDTCGAKFGQKQSLNHHIQKVHIEIKAYPCDRCHMSFNQELRLRAHLKAHTRARAYPCDKCSKVFTSTHSFKMHRIQVHTGERRHTCPNCGKTCKRADHLKLHMNTLKCKAHTFRQTIY